MPKISDSLTHKNVVCPFCSLHCDDLEINVYDNKLYIKDNIPKKYLNLVRDKSSGKKRIFLSDNDPKKLMKTAIIKINDLLEVEYLPEEIDSFLDKKIDVPGRFEIRKSKSKALIIDDSYNANPDSFLYAFKPSWCLPILNKTLL